MMPETGHFFPLLIEESRKKIESESIGVCGIVRGRIARRDSRKRSKESVVNNSNRDSGGGRSEGCDCEGNL